MQSRGGHFATWIHEDPLAISQASLLLTHRNAFVWASRSGLLALRNVRQNLWEPPEVIEPWWIHIGTPQL